MIVAGAYAYVQLSDYLDIVGNPMLNAPAIVLIVFGVITFIIAAIGCIGACKESSCLLFTFAIIIGILLVAEIAAGIAAFVYKESIEEWFNKEAPALMEQYKEGNKRAATDAWDFVQTKLECCGLSGPDDWLDKTKSPKQDKIPRSCGNFNASCTSKVVKFVQEQIVVIGGVGVGFGIIELFGIILACCVGCNVKRGTMA